jgi:hypothetical protein
MGRAAIVLALVMASLVLPLSPASAVPNEIVIGGPEIFGYGANGFPFSTLPEWLGDYPSTRYQQVYAASSFDRPFNIQQIVFYPRSNTAAPIMPATFEVYLSVTPYAVNEIDGRPFDANLGDRTEYFTSFFGGFVIAGDEFVIRGDPYLYNPSRGNLLLDIRISGAPLGYQGPYFAALGQGDAAWYEHGLFSRWHDIGTGFDNRGLVTGFRTFVPEPGTLGLLCLGLFGAVVLRRRERSVLA